MMILRSKQAGFLFLAFGLCALELAGCAPATVNKSPTTTAHEDHDHEHEHGIPSHKPKTLTDAVGQLVPRWKSVTAEVQAGHVEHVEGEFTELLDIIRWLPELAADTDLKKAEWEQVQHSSQELETIVLALRSSRGISNSEDFDTLAAQLLRLAESTVSPASESPHAATEESVESEPHHSAK
ncbi:hypothetical protein GC163_16160 [bacterium]|nr:hypothetical protein [bacterium]